MSASVWYEQVDRALVDEIRQSVIVNNKHGVPVYLDADAVKVRKPEEDFKIEVFPCVSIYSTNAPFDVKRYNPVPVVKDRFPEIHKARVEDTAVSFNLDYQIDLWSKYQTEMNEMTKSWLLKHFRQFNLSVSDDGGNDRSCNVLMTNQPTKSDLVSGANRLFHTYFTYSIWVELDNETRYNVNMVTSIKITDDVTQVGGQ